MKYIDPIEFDEFLNRQVMSGLKSTRKIKIVIMKTSKQINIT